MRTVLDTPNPWTFEGTRATIALMVIPVLIFKDRFPELCDRYMDWARANINHLKPHADQLRNFMNVDLPNEEQNAIFKERLTEFLNLM